MTCDWLCRHSAQNPGQHVLEGCSGEDRLQQNAATSGGASDGGDQRFAAMGRQRAGNSSSDSDWRAGGVGAAARWTGALYVSATPPVSLAHCK